MSTTTASAKLETKLSWQSIKDDTLAENKDENVLTATQSLAASASRRIYRERRTVTASTGTDDLDLTALTDGHGNSVNFSAVESVYVESLATTTGDKLQVGGAGAGNNAWHAPFDGDQDCTKTILPGGHFSDGGGTVDTYAVSGTSKVLRIQYDGSSGSISYEIAIVGTV